MNCRCDRASQPLADDAFQSSFFGGCEEEIKRSGQRFGELDLLIWRDEVLKHVTPVLYREVAKIVLREVQEVERHEDQFACGRAHGGLQRGEV